MLCPELNSTIFLSKFCLFYSLTFSSLGYEEQLRPFCLKKVTEDLRVPGQWDVFLSSSLKEYDNICCLHHTFGISDAVKTRHLSHFTSNLKDNISVAQTNWKWVGLSSSSSLSNQKCFNTKWK